jgi:hypothetical protein
MRGRKETSMTKTLSTLRCENCGATFTAEDLQRDKGVAVCSLCKSVLSLPPVPEPAGPLPDEFSSQRLVSWRVRTESGLPFLIALGVMAVPVAYATPAGVLLLCIPAYFGLAAALSRTEVLFDDQALFVRQRPFPLDVTARIDRAGIARVVCSVQQCTSRSGELITSYPINAVMKDGSVRQVGPAFGDEQRAESVSRALSRALGL